MSFRVIKVSKLLPILNKKKILIILVVFILCFASIRFFTEGRDEPSAVSLSNASSNGQQVNTETKTNIEEEIPIESDFFSGYRMERERVRGKQIEILNGVINQPDGDKQAKILAATQLVKITADLEKEMKAENLVKSKGYPECAVIMQAGNTSVVLKAQHLTSQDEIDIKRIVSKALDCSEDKLCIIIKAE